MTKKAVEKSVRPTVKKAANPQATVNARVRAYLAAQPPETRRVLKRIRDDIKATAPDAVEVFSYGLPGFRYLGKPLIWTCLLYTSDAADE